MKQESLSILFFILKNRPLKNGEAPILLRVTIDGNYEEIRIQRSVPINLWNAAKGKSNGKDRVAIELNEYLRLLTTKLHTIHKQLLLEEAYFTPEVLLKKLFSKEEKRTFLATFNKHIEDCKKLIGIDYEAVTINRYENCARSLAALIQQEFGKDDITFFELSGEFIRKFEFFLKTERGLCQNTLVRYMKCLKKVTNIAIANKWLRNDPFYGIKYTQPQTNPTFLTIDELEAIMKKEFAIERLNIVRDIFVFCCYTGLAFIDAEGLTSEDLTKDNSGCMWIRKPRGKLKRRYAASCISNVPLLGAAQKILEKYKEHPVCLAKGVCLPLYSNPKMNSYLKETQAVLERQSKRRQHERNQLIIRLAVLGKMGENA